MLIWFLPLFLEDHRFLLTNDELDEVENGTNTRTMVLDITDLDAPAVHFIHEHETTSIDHNNYVLDGRAYQSNYTTGLRVFGLSDVEAGSLTPEAFFDTYPFGDDPTFDGTWSNYPFFESGTIAVTGIGEGLFLVRLAEDDEGPPGKDKDKDKDRDKDRDKGRPDHAGPKPGRGPDR